MFLFFQPVKYGSPTIYDAFVCYNDRGPDQDFVHLIISKLERERGLKLFIPQRDDLAGTEQNKTSARLIEDRYTLRKHAHVLAEAVLTSTHNLCFGAKIRKIGIPLHI